MKVKAIAKKKARQAEQGNKLKMVPKLKKPSVKSKGKSKRNHCSVNTHLNSKSKKE